MTDFDDLDRKWQGLSEAAKLAGHQPPAWASDEPHSRAIDGAVNLGPKLAVVVPPLAPPLTTGSTPATQATEAEIRQREIEMAENPGPDPTHAATPISRPGRPAPVVKEPRCPFAPRQRISSGLAVAYRADTIPRPAAKKTVPIGIVDIDSELPLLREGELTSLIGAEGVGKTTMAATIVAAAKRAGSAVVVLSSEHGVDEYREFLARTGLNSVQLRRMYICEISSPADIRPIVTQGAEEVATKKPTVVILDHLLGLDVDADAGGRTDLAYGRVIRDLRALARDMRAAVLLFAHPSRGGAQADPFTPRAAECPQVERLSATVGHIVRLDKLDAPGVVGLTISKTRAASRTRHDGSPRRWAFLPDYGRASWPNVSWPEKDSSSMTKPAKPAQPTSAERRQARVAEVVRALNSIYEMTKQPVTAVAIAVRIGADPDKVREILTGLADQKEIHRVPYQGGKGFSYLPGYASPDLWSGGGSR